MLNIGDKAPEFELKDQQGNIVKLSNLKDTFVVLYFYPKDLTPGCTIEACAFRDYNKDLEKVGAKVLGIGGGDEKSKTKFSEKHKLNFPILQDNKNQVAKDYGVYQEKSMFGKKYMGINRSTFLIDPKGKIVYVWEKANPKNNAKQVLQKIQELKG